MAKINCLNPIAACGMDLFNDTYEVVDDFAAADAVLVRSAAMHDLELSDNLLAIARAGAGVNNIPLDKCAEKGIVVFNTPGANANGVKELVIAGLLLASRDLMGGYNWVKENASDENIAKTVEKQKKHYAGCEIMGKKLGVIGLGAIGVKVANCICLFGLHHIGAFPVDTWIKKILLREYAPKSRCTSHIPESRLCEALIEENFSKYPGFAGVLQQYIFFYERDFSQKALQDTSVIK